MGYLNRFENKPDLDFINLYSRLICFYIKRPSEKYFSDGPKYLCFTVKDSSGGRHFPRGRGVWSVVAMI